MGISLLGLKTHTAICVFFNPSSSEKEYRNSFDDKAIVLDEGRRYTGPDEIIDWRTNTQEKYQYIATPIELTKDQEKTVVVAAVEGNFPGSPLTLKYEFYIQSEQIKRLEILV